MLGFLLGFFHVPIFWIAIAVLAAIAVGLYFWQGPALLLKIVANPYVWLAAVVALGAMSVMHLEQENKDLKATVQQQQTQSSATTDAQKTDEVRVTQKTKRQTQSDKQQTVITNAKPGQAQDDLLDEISSERPDLNSSASASADGLRKQPDGTVNP